MIIRKYLIYDMPRIPDTLLFDIETTGLYWKRSHLYLIGAAVWKEADCWELTQWFAEKPGEEETLLSAFLENLSECGKIAHFNGAGFDIPYIQHKCTFYGLEDPFSDVESLDLYRALRPLKKMYALESFSQKEAETLTTFRRTDTCSGKELIGVYQDYLRRADSALLDKLLLHNFDDVQGMLYLCGLLPLTDTKNFLPKLRTAVRTDADTVSISFSLPFPLPRPFSFEQHKIVLSISQSEGTLELPLVSGTLKHFYPDYKNYYYLPLEDEAIHKSVALYVDREHRRKAAAANCYTKAAGEFLPILYPSESFLFREDQNSRESYMLWKDSCLDDREFIERCLVNTFRFLTATAQSITPPQAAGHGI